MNHNNKTWWKQKISVCLSAVLMLSVINTGPLYGAVDSYSEKTMAGFEEAKDRANQQEVSLDADYEDMELRESTPSDAEKPDRLPEPATPSQAKPFLKADKKSEEKPEGISLTAEAGDYLITVSADAEVFPEDVSLAVELMGHEDTAALKQAIEALEGAEEIPEKELAYFDVTILCEDGQEVQPDNKKGNVTISFENMYELLDDTNLMDTPGYQIYHMDEEDQTVEKKKTTGNGHLAMAEMDHISLVVIRRAGSDGGSGTTSVNTAEKLKNALADSTPSTILLESDITIKDTAVVLGANHTLSIPTEKILTVTGNINSYDKTTNKMYILTIQGGGTVTIPGAATDALRGKIDLGGNQNDEITVNLTSHSACVRADMLNVNKGAKIVIDSPEGNGMITVGKNSKLNVNDGGSIEIKNFKDTAIIYNAPNSVGTINSGGIIAINSSGTGSDNPAGIKLSSSESQLIINGGALTSEDGGSIYLGNGSIVKGMANKLSDQGNLLASNDQVTVGAADSPAAADKLTEGLYVGAGDVFSKKGSISGSISTGLSEGILTISTEIRSVDGEGWGWNGAILNINGKFSGNKQIVFAPGIEKATIKVNSGLTIDPNAGDIGISMDGDLTITSTAEKIPKLIINGPISAKNITITGNLQIAVAADVSDAALHAKSGSIVLKDTAEVTVRNESGAAMSSAPITETYENLAVTASEYASGSPAIKYQADNISSYKYLKFTKGSSSGLSTGLSDGILTISTENGGIKEQGWNWNGAYLDLNDKFRGNKQIVFAPGVKTAAIRVNRSLAITPDAGDIGIAMDGNLMITSTENAKLTANGPITAKSIIINGTSKVEASANASAPALQGKNGSITIGDTAAVTTNGSIAAEDSITISGKTSVVANADSPEAALYAQNGTIEIQDTATVISINKYGSAMNKAPNTESYSDLIVTASQQASGSPTTDYQAKNISSYKYLKFEKSLTVNEIESTLEKLDSTSSPELIDTVANQIRGLDSADRKNLKTETIKKVDDLLQEVTGIVPVPNISVPSGMTRNKQIQRAEISGALLAAGITTKSEHETNLEFRVVQKQPQDGAAVTFECDLAVNNITVALKVPVKVTIELPPEFFPIPGYMIHHVGDGIDEWLDFVYDGSDNSTQFETSSFSTFSIAKHGSSPKPGSGGGSSSGGGGSRPGTAPAGSGAWIQDATGWWYQYTNKSYPKDGWFQLSYLGTNQWYYFDKNGYMSTGWIKWNGVWYYLNETSNGSKGTMLTDTWVGEYYLNKEGIWEEGKKKQ